MAALTATVQAPAAQAAGAPLVAETWVSEVNASSANLRARINPNGLATSYRFEYITAAAYQANLAASPPREGFTGALKAQAGGTASAGAGEAAVAVVQHVGALAADTSYRYRIAASNSAGPGNGVTRSFRTEEGAPVFSLPDSRGWELVSPPVKNGGQVDPPETLFGGGAFQAAAQGEAVTYSSASSFAGGQGSPGASQYLSRRSPTGWATASLTVPQFAGGYDTSPGAGAPYRLFSADLSLGLLSNGRRCRGEASDCPVANPPLPGSGALPGYRDYYLRDGSGSFEALLGVGELGGLDPTTFEVAFVAATADLGQVVLASCTALTADATEAAAPGGCDPAAQNLYLHSAAGLRLVNLLPGQSLGTPGATIAAQGAGAVSPDGQRVYFDLGGDLYLRDSARTLQVDESVGGGGAFEAASADGGIAFFTKEAHLYRYAAATEATTDLTPAGGVQGVLGVSADGGSVYYLSSAGLQLWRASSVFQVAAGADPSDYPPATGTSRLSDDGNRLAFLSAANLTDYDSAGSSELYLYDAQTGALSCASCNPTGERPLGPASIPGAVANGSSFKVYKPRVLSFDGRRLFFDSADALVPQDTNAAPDVYQWEAQGAGSCTRLGGCIALISSGRSEGGASFIDASAEGSDAFFLTDGSLVPEDPGALDLYDAKVGGGFPAAPTPIPCVGDACQPLPPEPEDPTPGTLFTRAEGNPTVSFPPPEGKKGGKKGKGQKGKKGKPKHHHKKHGKKRGRR